MGGRRGPAITSDCKQQSVYETTDPKPKKHGTRGRGMKLKKTRRHDINIVISPCQECLVHVAADQQRPQPVGAGGVVQLVVLADDLGIVDDRHAVVLRHRAERRPARQT